MAKNYIIIENDIQNPNAQNFCYKQDFEESSVACKVSLFLLLSDCHLK